MNKPDYIIDIDAESYHKDARDGKYLSSHLLNDFRNCPKLYHDKMTGAIAPAETAAFTFGRATHKLVLEGREAFNEEYIVSDGPVNPKTGETFGRATKAYREWAATQIGEIISTSDFDVIQEINRAVWSQVGAASILTQGFAEGTVRTVYHDVPCQIRMDWFDPERLTFADLKTTDNLSFFEADIRKYGYLEQVAFYADVLATAMNTQLEKLSVYFIGVEKKAPFRCGLWKVTYAALTEAVGRNVQAITNLQSCKAVDEWPTGFEETRVIDVAV